jgi:hypothetical protein
MRSSRAWLERLAVSVKVATVLSSIPASYDTVKSEGAADKAVLKNVHKKIKKIPKNPPLKNQYT